MIVGNGLIARAFAEFKDDARYVFFGSGVSNSLCQSSEEFDRELLMVEDSINDNQDKIFIYFSTTSIQDPSMLNSMYVKHKKNIECFIMSNATTYCIFRLSNVVGKSNNKNTVLNFLFQHLKENDQFDLWKNSTRNLIDIHDVVTIVKAVLQKHEYQNKIINIANRHSYKVTEIVSVIEKYLGRKGVYNLVDKGEPYQINVDYIEDIIAKKNILFDSDYLLRLLNKYYSK